MFQPRFGAHRYGNSRCMMVQQTQENISVVAVNEAQHNTWMHPLQSNPSRFASPSRSATTNRPSTPLHVPLHHEHIHFTEPHGMIKAALPALTKQLHRILKNVQQTEENIPFFMQHDQKPKKTNREHIIIRLTGLCVLLVLANFMGLMPTRLFHSSVGWERLETVYSGTDSWRVSTCEDSGLLSCGRVQQVRGNAPPDGQNESKISASTYPETDQSTSIS